VALLPNLQNPGDGRLDILRSNRYSPIGLSQHSDGTLQTFDLPVLKDGYLYALDHGLHYFSHLLSRGDPLSELLL
jgi:hypothetical protein